MLKLLADQNIYKLENFLPEEILLTTYNPDNPLPDLKDFDVLFVRTVSKINESVIPAIPDSLKIIGTGSSGSDHIDIPFFESHGVKVIDAKGCNANAVGEYVITSLLLWSIKRSKNLQNLRVGIIGAGATGSAVENQCRKFGISTITYDPLREENELEYASASQEEVLDCDILTFHVPLCKQSKYSTFHWLNEEKLKDRKFELIINASRGGVIDEIALMKAMDNQLVSDVVIDVWENEPDFNTDLVDKAFIATPHIAGYSEQAKLNATKMLVDQISQIFDFDTPNIEKMYSPKKIELADLTYTEYELLLRLHPLREYDADIRNLCLRPDKAVLFQKLRIDRPYRYEYPYLKLNRNLIRYLKSLERLGIANTSKSS